MLGISNEDTNINNCLTEFLKTFKTYLHCELQIIESMTIKEHDLNQLLTKVITQIQNIHEQINQQHNFITQINWRTIERFCLRINEYLEYRINKSRTIFHTLIFNEMQAMAIAINKIFTQVLQDKGSEEHFSIVGFLEKIWYIENKFMINVFKNLKEIYKPTEFEEIIQQIIESKAKHQITETTKFEESKSTSSELSLNPSQRISFFRRKTGEENWATKLKNRKSNIEKKSQEICDNTSNISISFGLNNEKCKSTLTDFIISQRNHEEIESNEIPKKNTQTLKNLGRKNLKKANDLLEIDVITFQKHSNGEENLLKELLENNKKNSFIIEKYRKRALRKKSSFSPEKEVEHLFGSESFLEHKRSSTFNEGIERFEEIKKSSKVLTLPLVNTKKIKV